jgi:eukaryotic-like serine/threonine-protein kinase
MHRLELPIVEGYELGALLGTGGMGTVWRAQRRAGDHPVALKVLRAALPEGTELLDEVRCMAMLDHPHIARIIDWGHLASAAGEHPASAPWIAMELVEGGSLLHARLGGGWPAVRGEVAALLAALAHAHGRGLIHRDVKPSNVLITQAAVPVVKLTDFGLATALDRSNVPIEGSGTTAGTPAYMAPEQIRGDPSQWGAHTDLYAVGCMTWTLITGAPPFGSRPSGVVAQAKLSAPLPDFRPRMPVPRELEDWIRWLLERNPLLRCPTAAEAIAALPTGSLNTPSPRPRISAAPTTMLYTGDDTEPPAEEVARREQTPLSPERRVAPVRRPTLPPLWHPPTRPPGPAPGRRLLRLRPPPMVGRHEERALLWASLQEVHQRGQARAVVLTGRAGVGTSRLADWIASTAHEAIGAHRLVAHHDGGPRDGLAGMVRTFTGAAGDHSPAPISRMTLGASDSDRAALGALASPRTSWPGAHSGRGAALARFLTRCTLEAPAVVVAHDGHRDDDTMAALMHLLSSEARVLIVVTEAAEEGGPGHATLQRLAQQSRTTVVALGPLSTAAQRSLLVHDLGVGAPIAAQIEKRAGGHPQLLVQLVATLVEGGRLALDEGGTWRRTGEGTLELSTDVERLWQQRVERLLAELGAEERRILGLAAALGNRVDRVEWAAAGQGPFASVEHRLVGAGLANRTPDGGLAFAHAAVVASLQAQLSDAGSHAAVAEALSRLGANPGRVARHLVHCGEAERAVPMLATAAEHALRHDDGLLALQLIAARERALLASGVPRTDPRWGEGRVSAALASRLAGDPHKARTLLDALSPGQGWEAVMARVALRRAEFQWWDGDQAGAADSLADAHDRLAAVGDRKRRCRALQSLAGVHHQLGHRERALAMAERAADLARTLPDPWHRMTAELLMANLTRSSDPGRALSCARLAAELAAELGSHAKESRAINTQADVLRHRGELEAAGTAYERALWLYRSIGATSLVAELNLALLRLDTGEDEEAEPWMLALAESAPPPFLRTAVQLVRLWLAVPGTDFGVQLDVVREAILAGPASDPDEAHLAEHAARRLEGRRPHSLNADGAWRLAALLWRRLGDLEQAERCLARCAA